LNPAGLRARSFEFGESSKPMRCQQHLGGRLRFSLDSSNSAVFFVTLFRPISFGNCISLLPKRLA
jgi:hypothetical protein